MNLTSVSQVTNLLDRHGLRPKKRLGQSFLVDRNTLDSIARACCIQPDEPVLEIGCGLGVLTVELAKLAARVVGVEADRALAPILSQTTADLGGTEIVYSDVLKLDLPAFLAERAPGRWLVVGNLPYYVTTPILARLIDSRDVVSRMILMVQREVAERLKAGPGTDAYGALSVFVQFHCEVESVKRVSRNVFHPAPEVESELVRLTVRDEPAVRVDEELFFRIVRAAFAKRRKTLANALSSSDQLAWDRALAERVLADAGIDGRRRGETLSIEEFASIANARQGAEPGETNR